MCVARDGPGLAPVLEGGGVGIGRGGGEGRNYQFPLHEREENLFYTLSLLYTFLSLSFRPILAFMKLNQTHIQLQSYGNPTLLMTPLEQEALLPLFTTAARMCIITINLTSTKTGTVAMFDSLIHEYHIL